MTLVTLPIFIGVVAAILVISKRSGRSETKLRMLECDLGKIMEELGKRERAESRRHANY